MFLIDNNVWEIGQNFKKKEGTNDKHINKRFKCIYVAYPITAACIDHVEMLVMFLAWLNFGMLFLITSSNQSKHILDVLTREWKARGPIRLSYQLLYI